MTMARAQQISGTVLLVAMFLIASVHAQEESFELGAIPPPQAPPPLFVNSVEVGIGYQSLDSFHMGRYGGITDKGPFAVFNAMLDGGDAWDSGSGKFWNAAAGVLGFDTLSFLARYGDQGRWRVSAFYDGFTRAYTETARSPFNGLGTRNLTLPRNWVTGVSSVQFSTLAQNLKPAELKVAWQNVGGDFVLVPRKGYEVRLKFNHRNRQGLRGQSLPFGQEANFPVGIFFPQPVDYDSNQFNASVAYAGQSLQWTAAYALSIFTDKIDAVTIPNPYSRSLGTPWQGGAFSGYPLATGQYGLPPDSVAHQFTLSGGYVISPKTRVTVRLSYALQMQNDAFLPYTINALLSVPEPLPRTSFDGKIHKTHLAMTLASREWQSIDISAGYVFDDRANRSPMDLYSYVANDVQDQPQPFIPGNSRYIRRNLPHSYTFHQVKAEAGYRIMPRTRMSLAYTGDFKWRSYQQVARTNEHTLKTKLLSNFATGSAWISYVYADRSGSRYDDEHPWILSHTASYLNASVFNQSIEHPLLRKFFLADRKRHEAKGGLTFDATAALAINVSGGYAKDDYAQSQLGLRKSESLTFDADVSYVYEERLTASAFYSFERIRSDQNGYLIFGVSENNPAQNWSVRNRDAVHTAGLRLDWHAVSQKLKLGGTYFLSNGVSRTGTLTAPFNIYTMAAPLPAAREITHNLGVMGEYTVRPDTAVRVGYTVERHRSRDWQYDGIGFALVAQILGSGILSPRYTAHVVWVSTRYQF